MGKTEFEQKRDKALEQLIKGESLTGKDGVFAPLVQHFLKYVASKDQKTLMQDLKTVYQAPTKDKAELELDTLNDKWGLNIRS